MGPAAFASGIQRNRLHYKPKPSFRPIANDAMDASRTRVAPALYATLLHRTKADRQAGYTVDRCERVRLSERARTDRRLAGNSQVLSAPDRP